MFNGDSLIVQVWAKQVREGNYTLAQVPDIANLRAAVAECAAVE